MTFSTRLTAALVCGAAVTASVPATASAHAGRGELLDVVPVSTMDTSQLVTYLGDYDLDASRVRFGVDAKRIVYRTIDPTGKPTTASALIALPRNHDRSPRQVAWLHGTTGYRGSVASVADGNDRAAALLFASAGFLTTAPASTRTPTPRRPSRLRWTPCAQPGSSPRDWAATPTPAS